mgnify:CR=1 FL=1
MHNNWQQKIDDRERAEGKEPSEIIAVDVVKHITLNCFIALVFVRGEKRFFLCFVFHFFHHHQSIFYRSLFFAVCVTPVEQVNKGKYNT